MRGKLARRSSLFLLELMISILMFSFASAWCVRLFVTARSVVQETGELNKAQNQAAGYAELFLEMEDFEAFLLNEGAAKEETETESIYRIDYDRDWNVCVEKETFYFEVRLAEAGLFEKGIFRCVRTEGEEEIYSLEVEKYTGGEDAL